MKTTHRLRQRKIAMICKTCRTECVSRDAWAVWNRDAQTWELGSIFDQAYCNVCGGETSLEEKEI